MLTPDSYRDTKSYAVKTGQPRFSPQLPVVSRQSGKNSMRSYDYILH